MNFPPFLGQMSDLVLSILVVVKKVIVWRIRNINSIVKCSGPFKIYFIFESDFYHVKMQDVETLYCDALG